MRESLGDELELFDSRYAFDEGIVAVSSCESEGQGFLVSRHSVLKKNISQEKCIKRCIELLPLGDAPVSPPELYYCACQWKGLRGKG